MINKEHFLLFDEVGRRASKKIHQKKEIFFRAPRGTLVVGRRGSARCTDINFFPLISP